MKIITNPKTEFSRQIDADKVPAHGIELTLEAKDAECAALAKRLGLISVESLTARFVVTKPESSDSVKVKGSFTADVTQQCVVTLDPIPAHIRQEVRGLFVPASQAPSVDESGDFDENAEEIEPIENGLIDLGEFVVQNLSLALDPYPRKEGATLPETEGSTETKPTPFAVLKDFGKK